MINIFGKTLALIHVALSVMLMVVAVALFFNAVDFGWKQPARYWRDDAKSKGSNVLVPSELDKREAAMRQMIRAEKDQLGQIAGARHKLDKISMSLAENHLEGVALLTALESADGPLEIRNVQYTEAGVVLKPALDPRVGFPALPIVVKEVNKSYAKYLEALNDLDRDINQTHASVKKLQAAQEELTKRLTGKLDDMGQPMRDKAGNVIGPGWVYLTEAEVQSQRELQKELEYLQPFWVKEVVDAQMVVTRRDSLLRRLQELGDKEYLTQSEFLRKK
jgi:hypothetical protein